MWQPVCAVTSLSLGCPKCQLPLWGAEHRPPSLARLLGRLAHHRALFLPQERCGCSFLCKGKSCASDQTCSDTSACTYLGLPFLSVQFLSWTFCLHDTQICAVFITSLFWSNILQASAFSVLPLHASLSLDIHEGLGVLLCFLWGVDGRELLFVEVNPP